MDNIKVITIDHFYTNATVNRTEEWLKQQANDGWRLINKNGSQFTFRKCVQYKAEYFMYSAFNASKGICFDYNMAKKLYANTKAEINKNSDDIFEVDISKIDSKYEVYKELRNAYYKKHYMSLVFLFCPFTVLCLIFSFSYPPAVFALFFCLIIFLYASCSLIIFIRDLR